MTYDNFISKLAALFDTDDELEKLRKENDELTKQLIEMNDKWIDAESEIISAGWSGMNDLSEILEKAQEADDMARDFEEIHDICNNWR